MIELLKGWSQPMNETEIKLKESQNLDEEKCAICGGKNAELSDEELVTSDYFLIENKLYRFNTPNEEGVQITKHLKCAIAQILLREYQIYIFKSNDSITNQQTSESEIIKFKEKDSLETMRLRLFDDIDCLVDIAFVLFHEYISTKALTNQKIDEHEFFYFVEYVAVHMPEPFADFYMFMISKLEDHQFQEYSLSLEDKIELQKSLEECLTFSFDCKIINVSLRLARNGDELAYYGDVYFLYLVTQLDYLFKTIPVSRIYEFIQEAIVFSNNPKMAEYEIYKTIFWCLTFNRIKVETLRIAYEIKGMIENTRIELLRFCYIIEDENTLKDIYKLLYNALPRNISECECSIMDLESIYMRVTTIKDTISRLPATVTTFPHQVYIILEEIESYATIKIEQRKANGTQNTTVFDISHTSNTLKYISNQLDEKYFDTTTVCDCLSKIAANCCLSFDPSKDLNLSYDQMQLCNIVVLNISLTGPLELLLDRINELYSLDLMKYPNVRIALGTGLILAIILEHQQVKRNDKNPQFFIKPKPNFYIEFDSLIKHWNWDYKTLKTTSHEHLYMNPSYFSTNNLQSVMFFYDALNEIYDFPNQ